MWPQFYISLIVLNDIFWQYVTVTTTFTHFSINRSIWTHRFWHSFPAVIWLKYCWYGVKPYSTDQSINQSINQSIPDKKLITSYKGRVMVRATLSMMPSNMASFHKIQQMDTKLQTLTWLIFFTLDFCSLVFMDHSVVLSQADGSLTRKK